jgi:hypothetical protein
MVEAIHGRTFGLNRVFGLLIVAKTSESAEADLTP